MRLIKAFGDDWHVAWEAYKEAHHEDGDRKYYMVHTLRETLDIGVLVMFRRRVGCKDLFSTPYVESKSDY